MSPRPVVPSLASVIAVFSLLLAACGPRTTAQPPTAVPSGATDAAPTTAAGATQAPPTAVPPTAVPTDAPPDLDSDLVPDAADVCLVDYNPGQNDLDADGAGDACDDDVDGDGLANIFDACPFNTGEACSAGEPVVITLYGPADSAVATVQLASFANPDPDLPHLLNVLVTPAGEAPLWTSDGGFELALDIQPVPGLGDEALAGRLTVICPPTPGGDEALAGQCFASLSLPGQASRATTLKPAGLARPASQVPCDLAIARCGWGQAAAGAFPRNGWAAYLQELNTVRVATGLPSPLGMPNTNVYSASMVLPGGLILALTTAPADFLLPLTVTDPADDCTFGACPPAIDMRAARLDFKLINEQPHAVLEVDTIEPLSGPGALFSMLVLAQSGDTPASDNLTFYGLNWLPKGGELVLDVATKPWTSSTFNLGAPDDFPATLESAGNVLRSDMPLILPNGDRLIWFDALQSGNLNTGLTDSLPLPLDPNARPAPMAMFAWPTEADPSGLPLIAFPQHTFLADPLHQFIIIPFPGSSLATTPPTTPAKTNCGQLAEDSAPTPLEAINRYWGATTTGGCSPLEFAYDGFTAVLVDATSEGQALPFVPGAPAAPAVPVPVADPAANDTSVACASDLEVTFETATLPVPKGEKITVELVVTNRGPAPAHGILFFVVGENTARAGQPRFTARTGEVRVPQGQATVSEFAQGAVTSITLKPVAPGQSVVIEVEITPEQTGELVANLLTECEDTKDENNRMVRILAVEK